MAQRVGKLSLSFQGKQCVSNQTEWVRATEFENLQDLQSFSRFPEKTVLHCTNAHHPKNRKDLSNRGEDLWKQ